MRSILLTIAITAAFTCSAADNRSRETCDLQLEGVGSIRLQGNALSVTDMLAASLGPKDEFESNAAYQQRADKVLQASPIANGMICFREDSVVTTLYDADRQRLTVYLINKSLNVTGAESDSEIFYAMPLTRKILKREKYRAENAFGAGAMVEKTVLQTVNIAFSKKDIDALASSGEVINTGDALRLVLDASPELARSLNYNTSLVYQIELMEPYVLAARRWTPPLLSSPFESVDQQTLFPARLIAVSVQNKETGAIVATMPMAH
ncbi:hypothetical protein JY419_02255 [Stenotrophomonas maltophilia]|nr:hypothetical protein [Stenotrophomonas maltophilia]